MHRWSMRIIIVLENFAFLKFFLDGRDNFLKSKRISYRTLLKRDLNSMKSLGKRVSADLKVHVFYS